MALNTFGSIPSWLPYLVCTLVGILIGTLFVPPKQGCTWNEVEPNEHEALSPQQQEEIPENLVFTTVTCIIVLLIALTMAFEAAKEYVEHKASKSMEPIVEKLFGEMTVLGFLSMFIHIATKLGLFRWVDHYILGDDHHEVLELVELVHFSIFFIMVALVVQVCIGIRKGIEVQRWWEEMDATCRTPEVEAMSEDLVLFEALRDEFILERSEEYPFEPLEESLRVSTDFNFGRYLGVCLGHTLERVVDGTVWTWCFYMVATICYYVYARFVVDMDTAILAWTWVVMAWSLSLFHKAFEYHLRQLRKFFVPVAMHDDASSRGLLSNESLPGWCYAQERSGLCRGKQLSRQQSLYWMGRRGPSLYCHILQVNLIFVGLYCAVQLICFRPFVMDMQSPWLLVLYILLATLPVLDIMLNKKNTVAIMTQVTNMGVYRRPDAVAQVLLEAKTRRAVRTLLVVHRFKQFATTTSTPVPRRPQRRASQILNWHYSNSFNSLEIEQVEKSFDAIDHNGDGMIQMNEFQKLMTNMGGTLSKVAMKPIFQMLDHDDNGEISRDEFLQWYAEQPDDSLSSHENAVSLFEMFDTNHIGEITLEEFKRKLDTLNVGFSMDEVGAIVNELDEDNSGSIGLHEFEHLIETYYPKELARRKSSMSLASERTLSA